jgi:hypothetical protein
LDELKKMLWLRIARHVIEKENDVNKAMEFLHDLNDTIAIEDVLPWRLMYKKLCRVAAAAANMAARLAFLFRCTGDAVPSASPHISAAAISLAISIITLATTTLAAATITFATSTIVAAPITIASRLHEPARRDLHRFPVVYSKWKHVAAVR